MRTKTIPSVALCGAIASILTGCQQWPKDSYIQGAKSTVNTPWGPSTLEAEIIATGTAAKNISIPENAETKPKEKK